MKKQKKNILIILLIIFNLLQLITSTAQATTNSKIHIVEDSNVMSNLPEHFRKTTKLETLERLKALNLTGLDTLNISGSGQFTSFNLPLVINEIDNKFCIIDVDLREESHGFVNGIAISFENEGNNANKGLGIEDILVMENKNLSSIELDKPLTFYNNNKTLIPLSLKNEGQLMKENNITYLRIPVTDGGLPSEDMIKYFLDFVNNMPKNSWLHFHCKAGVGRTTTFMIMYDIIKNCNEVSLNDIIARETLLSNIPSKDAIDFFIGRRYTLLKNFYDNCKNKASQTCFLSSSNGSTSLNYLNTKDEGGYINSPTMPKTLYVIKENDMTKAEQVMISTLQGLVTTKTNTQIYFLPSSEPDYDIWLNDLHEKYKIKLKKINDPWALINIYKSFINGYVLYSSNNPPSINNACTLASLKNSIAIDEAIELKLNKYGVNNLIKDCKDTDKYWAYNTLWDSGLSHSMVIELSPEKLAPLRDYGILSKSLIFYEDDIRDSDLREKIFRSMSNNSHILGWGPDEHGNVSLASKYGINMVAADWAYNLSVLSSFKPQIYTDKRKKQIQNEDGFHYITFIMSDGDNLQWLLGNNFNNKNWFGSPYRKNSTLGWSLTPALYYLAPTVFNKYYESNNSLIFNENFIVAPSGNGYIYPSKMPYDKLDQYTSMLNDYMKKVNQRYVLILDDEAFYKKELWNEYTNNSNIDGLFYLNYNKNNSYEGKILWSNNKPVVACRDLLWVGLENENDLIANINNRVASGYTKINDPNSYTFVYVHVWSNTMDNILSVENELYKNPKVKLVSPNEFMQLIQKNLNANIEKISA